MSNFFISIGFLITAIQIFTSKKMARAYDSTDYSLMGDFYLLSGVTALAGAILFFWLGYRSIKFKDIKKDSQEKMKEVGSKFNSDKGDVKPVISGNQAPSMQAPSKSIGGR